VFILKIQFNRIIIITVVVFISIWILFFLSFYGVRKLAITEFNKQQMIMAEQAAQGITAFMEHLADDLDNINYMKDALSSNAEGMGIVQDYYNRNSGTVKSITRMDAKGRILWTVPHNKKVVGADISSQEHVEYLLREHKTSLSDVFTAVQGYMAIALHVPVFRNGEFRGSLGVLLDFDNLSEKYIKQIKLGEGGYAWMLSAKGTELYCPVPGHIGKTIYETSSMFPDVISMAERMMRGEKGSTSYNYNLIKEKFVGVEKKHASFTPVKLFNTHWSIVVATPEKQILVHMIGIRNKLILTAFFLLFINIVFVYFAVNGRRMEYEILQKRRYEAFLIENESVLEAALQSAGEVAGGIAHDLNNVFAGIINSTEVIEMKHKGDEKSEKYTGFIKDAASRGTVLVKKILNLSLMGNGVHSFVDVNRIIEEAGDILPGENGGKVKLKTRLKAADYMVKAAPLNMRKIIIRLLTRLAGELSDGGGLILSTENIRVDKQFSDNITPVMDCGDYLKIKIQTFNNKSEARDLSRLFHFLKNLNEPDDKVDPGIYDIYRRIRDIAGVMALDAESGAEIYTAVLIYLPVSKVDKTSQNDKNNVSVHDGGTILIVEDDPAIRNALARILGDLGYNIFTAEDGEAGVDIFRREHKAIDLVILDVVMPVKGGIEALKEIREIDNGALVYMTSGYVAGVSIDDLISKGAAGFINKPVTISDLSALVSGAIAGKKKNHGDDSSGTQISKA